MPPSPSSRQNQETRELILEAAGQIFAEFGFHATTVRQITRAVGVNVAAINYHFRDKQELYVLVLQRAHQAAARTASADLAGTPQKKMFTFIHGFLDHLLDPQRPAWHGQLIARELVDPTPALDRLVQESIVPVKERLAAIVRELLGSGATPAQVRRVAFSVLGQCLYYVHCGEMIKRLFPGEAPDVADLNALTHHIFTFSIGGIASIRRQKADLPKAGARRSPAPTRPRKSP